MEDLGNKGVIRWVPLKYMKRKGAISPWQGTGETQNGELLGMHPAVLTSEMRGPEVPVPRDVFCFLGRLTLVDGQADRRRAIGRGWRRLNHKRGCAHKGDIQRPALRGQSVGITHVVGANRMRPSRQPGFVDRSCAVDNRSG